MLNEDYREMLQILLDQKVEFLVVGAYAMASYGYPRATGYMDLWVRPDLNNSKNIYAALKVFGAPLATLDPADFTGKALFIKSA